MTVQTVIQKFHPSRKFLILLGLLTIFLVLASIAQALVIIPFIGIENIHNAFSGMGNYSDPNLITGLKTAQAVGAVLTFIAPAFIFAWFCSEEKLNYLKINKSFSFLAGLLAIMLVFTAMPLINWLGELNSNLKLPAFLSELENSIKNSEESLKKVMDAFLKMDGVLDFIINVIIIALLAAVGEELLFRGCVQNILLEWIKNKHVGIWITAIIFSALHFQFYGFLPRMILGVVLGYLYLWSGSLWLSILFHFFNNGMAVLFSYLISNDKISKNAETIGSGDSPIYLVVVSTVLSILLMSVIYKNKEESNLSQTEISENL